MTTRLIAIDPGAISGAFAIFHVDPTVPPMVGDLPVVDRQVNSAEFSRLIRELEPSAAVVELVGAMPKQGVSSTFRFGVAVGIVRGVLAGHGVPIHYVSAPVWKKALQLTGKDKDVARGKAIYLYPQVVGLERKKDGGRADALLIGHYWLNYRDRASEPPVWASLEGRERA